MVAVNKKIKGAAGAGVDASGDVTPYALPQAPAHIVGLPPAGHVGAPRVPVVRLAHRVHPGVSARAPASPLQFEQTWVAKQVDGAELSYKGRDKDEVRKFFYTQSRTGPVHLDENVFDEANKVAPHQIDPLASQAIANHIVARRSARVNWAGRGGPQDGFKTMTVLGYFLAVAAEAQDGRRDANDPEVIVANAVLQRLVDKMVAESDRGPNGEHTVTPEIAKTFLLNSGNKLSASTQHWLEEQKAIESEPWYKPFPPPQFPKAVVDNTVQPIAPGAVEYRHVAPSLPAADANLAAVDHKLAIADDNDTALRHGLERAVMIVRLATRDAINQGRLPQPIWHTA